MPLIELGKEKIIQAARIADLLQNTINPKPETRHADGYAHLTDRAAINPKQPDGPRPSGYKEISISPRSRFKFSATLKSRICSHRGDSLSAKEI